MSSPTPRYLPRRTATRDHHNHPRGTKASWKGIGEIRLMLVVNPCCYWVTCSDCPSLQDVHDLLDSYKPVPVKRVPEPGDKVVINRFDLDVQKAMWYRAVVSSYDKLGNMCHVYLPDSMTAWMLTLSLVYTIDNSKWEEISTPHIIGLQGGVPAPTDSDSLKAHAIKCTSDILQSHEDNVLEFSFVEKCKSKSSPSARRVDDILVFGNVTLKTPECTKDLLDRLVHTRKVIQPENYFEVLENDGWLTSVEKTIRHVERSLNSKLSEAKQPEKVPPPSSPKDLERVAVSSRHNQLKGQIPQTTKTETNEKQDPQMGRSTESAKPPILIGRGVFMQNVKSATNVKSNLKSPTEECCQMPKPPVACGRGWVLTPRIAWPDRSCSSVTLPGRSSDAADGQFDDAGLSYTASVTSADDVLSRDPAVLKIMTSAVERRVEASDEQPSAGRGRILKRPLSPSCQKSPCSEPDAPSDFGSRTFSSKPVGSELGGKLSTPGTERALPDHETLPAAEPSILVQRSPRKYKFSDSDQSPVLQFGTKDQPHHLNPISGSKQNSVFEFGKKSQQNPNSVSIMGDKSEPKASVLASAGESERPASVHDEQNGIHSNGINKPVGGACNGTKPDQGNLLGFLSDSGVVVSSKSLEDTKGLIFGEGSSDLKVAGHLGDLNLHLLISKSARRASLMNLTRVQSLAMPAILERRDVLLIGPNRTKKTSAYLVPLMSLLMDPDYYSALPPVSCSTVTVTKCQAALRTLQAFPFFTPTCLCREPQVDHECNSFRNFLFDHPCIFVIKKEKDPYPIDALPTCNHALSVCQKDSECQKIYEKFKSDCKVRDGKCHMEDREQCLESWSQIRMTPMFGCICPNNHFKKKCERIFSLVNHNPCLGLQKNEEDTNLSFQNTCDRALDSCNHHSSCKTALSSVMQYCSSTRCRREHCMQALQNFYRNVDSHWSLEIAFCLCKKTKNAKDECLVAQELLHPVCAQQPENNVIPTCLSLAQSCQDDQACRIGLENYVQACAVDSVTKQCAAPPHVCRKAMLGILGTALRSNCACKGTDFAQLYDCIGWQRVLWFNPCVVESQRDFHAKKRIGEIVATEGTASLSSTPSRLVATVASTTSVVPTIKIHTPPPTPATVLTTTSTTLAPTKPPATPSTTRRTTTPSTTTTSTTPSTTTSTTTTTTTTSTTTTTTTPRPPPTIATEYCVVQKTDQPNQYIAEGDGIRLFREGEPDCTDVCQCPDGSLICNTICVLRQPCKTDFAFYNHAAPAYQAYRGRCLCYSGRFICMRPAPDTYELPPGVYLFLGFSSADEGLLKPLTNMEVQDAVVSLHNLLRLHVKPKTPCMLSMFKLSAENVILVAKLSDSNSTLTRDVEMEPGLLEKQKEECEAPLQEISEMINNQDTIVHSHLLLSIFKMAEVEVVHPAPSSAFGLAPSIFVILTTISWSLTS